MQTQVQNMAVNHTGNIPDAPVLYESIYDLPLIKFIKCFDGEKYDELIISGKPDSDMLTGRWKRIKQQYTEAIGGAEVESQMKDVKQIIRLESKIKRVEGILRVLYSHQCKETFDMMYTCNYRLPRKEYSENNLQIVLKIFIGFYKLDKTVYMNMIEKYRPQLEGKEPVKKSGIKEFSKILTQMSIGLGLPPVSIQTILTSDYCNMYTQYKELMIARTEANKKTIKN